jgi:hypothetical protein
MTTSLLRWPVTLTLTAPPGLCPMQPLPLGLPPSRTGLRPLDYNFCRPLASPLGMATTTNVLQSST